MTVGYRQPPPGAGFMVWEPLMPGEKLTFTQWFSLYVSTPLLTFRKRSKITPELRERCVRYAIDGGANGSYSINNEAQRIALYITGASDT